MGLIGVGRVGRPAAPAPSPSFFFQNMSLSMIPMVSTRRRRAPAALEPSAVPKAAADAPVSSVAEVEGLCATPAVYNCTMRARGGAQRPFAAFSMGGALRFALLLALVTVSDSYVLRPPPCRAARRACAIRAQLVPVEKPDDDDDDGAGADDSKILSVSQVEDAAGQAIEAVGGRSVASVQFMITNAMRAQLGALGYSAEEVDRMDPPRAAAILAQGVPSSKQAQSRPKRKTDRFELQFTCNVCDAPNSHSISRHAHAKGTVLVTCPNCNSAHLIADNLNWIEDTKNLEEYMERQGKPITKLVNDGVAESAAAEPPPRSTPSTAASTSTTMTRRRRRAARRPRTRGGRGREHAGRRAARRDRRRAGAAHPRRGAQEQEGNAAPTSRADNEARQTLRGQAGECKSSVATNFYPSTACMVRYSSSISELGASPAAAARPGGTSPAASTLPTDGSAPPAFCSSSFIAISTAVGSSPDAPARRRHRAVELLRAEGLHLLRRRAAAASASAAGSGTPPAASPTGPWLDL